MIIIILAGITIIILLYSIYRKKESHYPPGYHRVSYHIISRWAQKQCKKYKNEHTRGFKYFSGKTYAYAVYYYANGRYTIYSKRR